MRECNEIVNLIKKNENEIVKNIDKESIAVYLFLQNEFAKGDVNKNNLFQFVYRSFYRIDNAGLTNELKQEYFKIMEECRHSKNLDPKEIVMRLYIFKTLKGQNSIQFSFTTKMIHTINVDFPIYDSNIMKVFDFSNYYTKNIEEKIDKFLKQQNMIIEIYKNILEKELLNSTIQLFDKTFINNRLPDIKKLDFIFWSCGKIINKSSVLQVSY